MASPVTLEPDTDTSDKTTNVCNEIIENTARDYAEYVLMNPQREGK